MKRTFSHTLLVLAALSISVAGCGSSDSDDPAASAVASTSPTADSTSPTADSTSPPVDSSAAAVDSTTPATDTASSVDESTGDSASEATDAAPAVTELADGPISVIALGDSLTYGEGDEAGLGGFVGRLTESINAVPDRSGSTLTNFGISGWHSTGMVEGQDGSPSELGAAVPEVEAAVAAGRAVLATVLIGSNDLWYLYEYPAEDTSTADEDAAAEVYRNNLERTVRELSQAGALVVLGLPDDQSLRPCSVDLDYLHNYLPNITAEEIQQMSAMSTRLAGIVEEVAAAHGLRTVDTNGAFWADRSKMAEDLIHPNGDGYAELADLWLPAIQDLL